jgi:DNA-binding Lrp family transcriptional regulator
MARDSFKMDELDLRIVNALQIQPRASWRVVGAAVGTDPGTAARRWERLVRAGATWISCYPPFEKATMAAFVEIDCAHGHVPRVAAELARDPHTMTINITAGGRDILVELVTKDAHDFAAFSLERLGSVAGIRDIRTHPMINVYTEAARWELRTLDPAGRRRLRATARRASLAIGQPSPTLTEHDWIVARCLADDARISIRELAASLGVSPATARRRLDRVLTRQTMLRCELARTLSGWPIQATFFADCPADRIEATGRALSKIPEIRTVASTAGPHNLFLAVWLRSLAHVQALEAELAAKLPHLSVVDRAVVMRPVKLVGRLLDEDGWTIGNVPVDIRRIPTATQRD